jgi:hypothetical protein
VTVTTFVPSFTKVPAPVIVLATVISASERSKINLPLVRVNVLGSEITPVLAMVTEPAPVVATSKVPATFTSVFVKLTLPVPDALKSVAVNVPLVMFTFPDPVLLKAPVTPKLALLEMLTVPEPLALTLPPTVFVELLSVTFPAALKFRWPETAIVSPVSV